MGPVCYSEWFLQSEFHFHFTSIKEKTDSFIIEMDLIKGLSSSDDYLKRSSGHKSCDE